MSVIKQVTEEIVSDNTMYEIYDTVKMQSVDDKEVEVLQLRETITKQDLTNRIRSLDQQIVNIETQKTRVQADLDSINAL